MHYDNKNKKQIKTYFPLAFYFLMIIFLVSMKGDNNHEDATPVKLSIVTRVFIKPGLMFVCRCNNCDEYYEDMNPGDESFEHSDDLALPPLVQLQDDDGVFRGCGQCGTDGYLMDVAEDLTSVLSQKQ